MISVVIFSKALYYGSILDLGAVAYFLALQEIRLGPKM